MIPQDFIQNLLGRVDIVDVIDKYVKLKKSGSNFSACCPFHNEKTPSFSVSPSKQFYHCFGCGVHGNAIGFLMEYSGQTYPDAIRTLAESVGLEVPEVRSGRERPQGAQAPGLAVLMMDALNHYRALLKKSPVAIEYLKKRGLSGEIAARYGLGYAPDEWQGLEAVFADYRDPALKDTGLVIDNDQGKRYDRFRGRVMFPILDSRGNVIGFGGRVIGEGEPKYLNSPETPLFEKGRELYGLYQARRAIRDANLVLVVEGYMDVVALAQHGVENAVATLGTATTPVHVTKLLRLADNVVFSFDGDNAGRKAAWRALEVALPVLADGKAVSFLFLPSEDDPDSYVRKHGRDAFMKVLDEARPLSQFLFSELASRVDMTTEEGRARFVSLAKPLVTQVQAPALAVMLRRRMGELAGLSESELQELVPTTAQARKPAAAPARTSRAARTLELKLLARILSQPALSAAVPDEVLGGHGSETGALRAVVGYLKGAGKSANLGQVSEYFKGSEHQDTLDEALGEKLLEQAEGPGLDLEAEVLDLVEKLGAERKTRRLKELAKSGQMTTEELAEFQLLSAWQRQAKSGNQDPESRSKV
ncbi:DNA primase [Usitatibacter palustris]|uniref:DNA primase n=1 Tax=Usitatibacter palustris TaxID=2732487 RepID=A0A6M4H3A5_9PROT|nr:DNA primase [Usitatibacter palustris]QJR13910.1 DNA primase [Usitatibacter palustris]